MVRKSRSKSGNINNHKEIKIIGFDFRSALKVFVPVYLVLSLVSPLLLFAGYAVGVKEYVAAVNAAGFSVFLVVFLSSFFGGLFSFSIGLLAFNAAARKFGLAMKYER